MNYEIVSMMKALMEKHGQIPQGMKELGIEGRRDSDARYVMYGFDAILKDNFRVLDIGSNCGFLTCLVARKVRKAVGIDHDRTLIEISNAAATALNIRNCVFFQEDIKEFHPEDPFDLVIACQVHMWVHLPFNEYVIMLMAFVKPGGYLLFESHDLDNVDADIDDKLALLIDSGFTIIHSGHWVEDPGPYWIPPKKHKKIPRQYYLMGYDI